MSGKQEYYDEVSKRIWNISTDTGEWPEYRDACSAILREAFRNAPEKIDEMEGMQSCGPDGPEGHDAIPRKPEPTQATPRCAHDSDIACVPSRCDASGECASRPAQAASSETTLGDKDEEETIDRFPRSWIAWKREAQRLEAALAEERERAEKAETGWEIERVLHLKVLENAEKIERELAIANAKLDSFDDRYHPEFGSEWQDDGEIGKVIKQVRDEERRKHEGNIGHPCHGCIPPNDTFCGTLPNCSNASPVPDTTALQEAAKPIANAWFNSHFYIDDSGERDAVTLIGITAKQLGDLYCALQHSLSSPSPLIRADAPESIEIDLDIVSFIDIDSQHGASPIERAAVELAAEVRRLRAQLAEERSKHEGEAKQKHEMRWIDATPDTDYIARVLRAYLDENTSWSDNTLGLPPDNPLIIQMNKWQAERNALIKAALEKLASPAPDATALREALRVCGNCKHGQPTSLDDTRCYKATPYVPVERWAKACADWSAAPTRDNPRAALLRSEPRVRPETEEEREDICGFCGEPGADKVPHPTH